MHVEGVLFDSRTSSPVLVLREETGAQRKLPIWIGPHEAMSIQRQMDEVPVPRPNTHDLMKNVLLGLGARIERVVVTELRDNTYYAEIDLDLRGRSVSIDSRPSDAIAIAVRTGAPVFATGKVLLQAGRLEDEGEAHDVRWEPTSPRGRSGRVGTVQ